MSRGFVLFGLLSSLIFAGGCGGGGGSVVKGKVLYNGSPLAGAEVTLATREKKGPSKGFTGKTDAEGNFVIRGYGNKPVPPGKYQVRSAQYGDKKGKEPSAEDYGQLLAQGQLVNKLPPAYNDPASSDIVAEVKEGDTVLPPFELKGPSK
jgi:hypothetical protein